MNEVGTRTTHPFHGMGNLLSVPSELVYSLGTARDSRTAVCVVLPLQTDQPSDVPAPVPAEDDSPAAPQHREQRPRRRRRAAAGRWDPG